jgi:hypothetical protein
MQDGTNIRLFDTRSRPAMFLKSPSHVENQSPANLLVSYPGCRVSTDAAATTSNIVYVASVCGKGASGSGAINTSLLSHIAQQVREQGHVG